MDLSKIETRIWDDSDRKHYIMFSSHPTKRIEVHKLIEVTDKYELYNIAKRFSECDQYISHLKMTNGGDIIYDDIITIDILTGKII